MVGKTVSFGGDVAGSPSSSISASSVSNMSIMFDDDYDDDLGATFLNDVTMNDLTRLGGAPSSSSSSAAAGSSDYGRDLVARPRMIKKIAINFAKAAKKVDVKKLKENLWAKMVEEQQENSAQSASQPQQRGAKGREQPFTSVMASLHEVYPERKLKDISPSFCFICLLHLANENNLAIRGTAGMDELLVQMKA